MIVSRTDANLVNVNPINLPMQCAGSERLLARAALIMTRPDHDRHLADTIRQLHANDDGILSMYKGGCMLIASPRDDNDHRDERAFATRAVEAARDVEQQMARIGDEQDRLPTGRAAVLDFITSSIFASMAPAASVAFDFTKTTTWSADAIHRLLKRRCELHDDLHHLSLLFTAPVDEGDEGADAGRSDDGGDDDGGDDDGGDAEVRAGMARALVDVREARGRANAALASSSRSAPNAVPQTELRNRLVQRMTELIRGAEHDILQDIAEAVYEIVKLFADVEAHVGAQASEGSSFNASSRGNRAELMRRARELRKLIVDELERSAAAVENGMCAEVVRSMLSRRFTEDASAVKVGRFPLLITATCEHVRNIVRDTLDVSLAAAVREFVAEQVASERQLFTIKRTAETGPQLLYDVQTAAKLAGKLEMYLLGRGLEFDAAGIARTVLEEQWGNLDLTEEEQVVAERRDVFLSMARVDRALADVAELRNASLARQHARVLENDVAAITPEQFQGFSEREVAQLAHFFRGDDAFTEARLFS